MHFWEFKPHKRKVFVLENVLNNEIFFYQWLLWVPELQLICIIQYSSLSVTNFM